MGAPVFLHPQRAKHEKLSLRPKMASCLVLCPKGVRQFKRLDSKEPMASTAKPRSREATDPATKKRVKCLRRPHCTHPFGTPNQEAAKTETRPSQKTARKRNSACGTRALQNAKEKESCGQPNEKAAKTSGYIHRTRAGLGTLSEPMCLRGSRTGPYGTSRLTGAPRRCPAQGVREDHLG